MKQQPEDNMTTADLTKILTQTITEAALADESVAIPGFGTFAPVKTEEHVVDGADGSKVLMPPAIKLSFKASIILRNKLR